MKTIKYILPTLLLSVALWSSCGQEEDDEINALRSVAPLVIGSVSVERTEEAGTRAVPEDFTGTEGYLYVGRRAANGYEAGGALYMPGPSGGWQPGLDQGLTLTANAASLYAYFPYGSYTDNKIPLTAQVYDLKKDVFCDFNGGENVCATYPSAAFVLKSQYALIKLQLTLDNNYNAATAALTHIRLQSTPDGTFLQSAVVDAGGNGEMGEENYASTLIPVTATLSKTTATEIKLLVPEQYVSDTKLDIVFTVDEALRKISIPAAKFTPVAGVNNAYRLQRGYSYTIPVTLTNSYNAEGIPIIYNGTIQGYWAPGNLIATPNSDGTYSYRFAGEQGYCEEEVEFSYFAWNALTPDAKTHSGTTFDNTKDPCQLVGSEWRTPHAMDFAYLQNATKSKVSVWIMDNGTTVNGRYYFSIEDAALFDSYSDADKKKYGQHLRYNDPMIFLPAAGSRSSIGSYTGFNTELKYWTRYPNGTDEAIVMPGSTSLNDKRTLKLPIRCIKWGYKN